MTNLYQLRELFRPGLYVAAGRYERQHGIMPAWDIGVTLEPPGIVLTVTLPTDTRTAFISEAEIEKATEAEAPWRYRLLGGPKAWRARALWKRRAEAALIGLFLDARDKVFA